MKITLSALIAMLTSIIVTADANADLIATVTQTASGVEFNGTGTLNVADLTQANFTSTSGFSAVNPSVGEFSVVGSAGDTSTDLYSGSFTTPGAFGSGTQITTGNRTGSVFGFQTISSELRLVVPDGYVSGTTLTGSATYDGETLASMGLTPGSYTWSWGSGANADSMTLNIAAVPEPSGVVFFAAAGAIAIWRRRRSRSSRRARVSHVPVNRIED